MNLVCGSESGDSEHSDDGAKGASSPLRKERFGVSRTPALSDFGTMSEADEDEMINEIVSNAGSMNVDRHQSIAEEPAELSEAEVPVSARIDILLAGVVCRSSYNGVPLEWRALLLNV